MTSRRTFLRATAGTGVLGMLGDLDFLHQLPSVSAADAHLAPSAVRFDPGIEPTVRLLEETARDRVLEEVATRVRNGLSYQELLAALLLAGVRNIQPRPVGFKFHAVLVVNSAHLASLASADKDRWLPIFWAIDQFKSSQAADVREGNWTMPAVEESKVPPAHRARKAFIEAMDNWDEQAADAAVVGLARCSSADELFEIFSRYGARDFRDIGHKAIYVANSFRTLEVIGWHHAEPVLRSLAYALLERGGDDVNPARADLAADRPFRQNLPRTREIREDWLGGSRTEEATRHLLDAIRTGSPADVASMVVQLLNHGAAPAALFDALFIASGEMLMRAPGIRSLHAVTFTNAMRYAWGRCADTTTRKLLLLQNAAFLPLFRGAVRDHNIHIDRLEPVTVEDASAGLDEIFADISSDRLRASAKLLGWLEQHQDPQAVADTARRLIFLKGRNSHDYKFSSAVLEDYVHVSPPWRNRFMASSVFNLRGSGESDTDLVRRIQNALA